jgi:hypothetical protein
VVWPPPPGAAEIPELPENPEPPVAAEPELLAEPEEAGEPVDVLAEEPDFCDADALPVELPELVVLARDEPGRAYATAPATARPAAPTAMVAARSRDWPRRRAAAAAATGRACPGGASLPLPRSG